VLDATFPSPLGTHDFLRGNASTHRTCQTTHHSKSSRGPPCEGSRIHQSSDVTNRPMSHQLPAGQGGLDHQRSTSGAPRSLLPPSALPVGLQLATLSFPATPASTMLLFCDISIQEVTPLWLGCQLYGSEPQNTRLYCFLVRL
jgi:hypothetical protein